MVRSTTTQGHEDCTTPASLVPERRLRTAPPGACHPVTPECSDRQAGQAAMTRYHGCAGGVDQPERA